MASAEDLGASIHRFLPYRTFFVDNDHEIWSGALFDGKLSPDEQTLPAIYDTAIKENTTFCLVFRDQHMLDTYLSDTDTANEPMRTFVRQVRAHHGKMVLLVDELAEILGEDLKSWVQQNHTWHSTLNLADIDRKYGVFAEELSYSSVSMWGMQDWAQDPFHQFRFIRMMHDRHQRLELMLGRTKMDLPGEHIRYGVDSELLFTNDPVPNASTVVLFDDDQPQPLVLGGYSQYKTDDPESLNRHGMRFYLMPPDAITRHGVGRRNRNRAVDRLMPMDVMASR